MEVGEGGGGVGNFRYEIPCTNFRPLRQYFLALIGVQKYTKKLKHVK